ncbi:MAG: hypothetical protein K6C06_08535 [Lachnospiraceae bacterium]|nr:hypothetical protein [Lachnospiraceae bacterium]
MKRLSVGELVKLAKGEDRSLREYARDSGVDAAILSKMINGTYIPKKAGIYEALTNQQAAPRGGVTCQQMLEAAGTSEEYQNGMSAGISVGMLMALRDIPSSALKKVLKARGISVGISAGSRENPEASSLTMKPEEARRIQRLQSEKQRFTATANGIILGSLGKKGLTFQLVHTDGTEVDSVRFDTCVRLMDRDVSEYLIRYAFISEEEVVSPALAENTVRRMIEELVFLKPSRDRIVSVVTNHPGAYEDLCACKDSLSYNGELSVLLFDLERARILKEEYLSHYISEDPVREIRLL